MKNLEIREKNAIEFLRNITEKDIITTIFHNDTDGICSCVLINKFLKERIGKSSDFIISQPMPLTKTLIQRIKLAIPTKIIVLDLAIDQEKNLCRRLEGISETLVIDHHQITNMINFKRIIYYNPLLEKDVYQSTSYLIYKLCSKIIDMKNYLWISLIGIAGDYNINNSLDLIEEGKNLYQEFIQGDIKKNFINSIFGKASDIITAMRASHISSEKIAKIIESMDNIKEIEQRREMIEYYERVQNEIVGILASIKNNAEITENILFYEIKSKYNLRSVISTKLSEIYPNKIIFLWEVSRNKVKFSVRNQSGKIDINRLLKEASKDFRTAITGGHKLAAGGLISREEFDLFKEKIKQISSKEKLIEVK
ncbi:MAG: DHH family phosphoesterase [Candidatus Aenigmatarchaeota archaeon]|nr:DHH family phosphoesterase [Candidatus Aenigmarchaeota archaeon]